MVGKKVDSWRGTNPEEILGAAHAVFHDGVFLCPRRGRVGNHRWSKQDEGFVIDHIRLILKATVPASMTRNFRRSPRSPNANVRNPYRI